MGTGVIPTQVHDACDERRDGNVRERQGTDVHVSRRGARLRHRRKSASEAEVLDVLPGIQALHVLRQGLHG